jgi:hypothetical protein
MPRPPRLLLLLRLAFSPDGRWLAAYGATGLAHVWDLVRGGALDLASPHLSSAGGDSSSGYLRRSAR